MDTPIVFTGVSVLRSNTVLPERYRLTIDYLKQSITFSKRNKKFEIYNILSIMPTTSSVKIRIRVIFQNNEYVVLSHKDHMKLLVALVNMERVCNIPSLFIPAMHYTVMARVSQTLRDTMQQPDDLSTRRRIPPVVTIEDHGSAFVPVRPNQSK